MRLIDADKLLHEVKMSTKLIAESRNATARNVVKKVLYIIEHSETVDAEPVRHGKWIALPKEFDTFCKCSLCNYPVDFNWGQTNYCPNCGAKMDGDEQWQNF